MQSLDFARAAAAAEGLRLKRMVRRQVTRAVFGVIAGVFMLGALVWLHVLGYLALAPYLPPVGDSAVLLGADVLLVIAFGVLAMRDVPDAMEVEAKLLRNQSLGALKEMVAIATLVGPLGRLAARAFGKKNALGLTLAALAARFLAGNRK